MKVKEDWRSVVFNVEMLELCQTTPVRSHKEIRSVIGQWRENSCYLVKIQTELSLCFSVLWEGRSC